MKNIAEKYLSPEILQKSIVSGNEYGWKRIDFKEVIEIAIEQGLAILGGQPQFKLPDGTCELSWHTYDTTEKKSSESWRAYCQRTQTECLEQFDKIPTDYYLIKEGINRFISLKDKIKKDVEIVNYLIFTIDLIDLETALEYEQ